MPVRATSDDDTRTAAHDKEAEGEPSRPRTPPLATTTRVRFSFHHRTDRHYSLWYYGHERHTLAVSDLSVRQLVYSCDCNGHNPLHVLLMRDDDDDTDDDGGSGNLRDRMSALVAAGYGARDSLPIHHALRAGASERTIRCLVEALPSAALLDVDAEDERRTPLHAALRGTRKMPDAGVVRALLASAGVNATHLKDRGGNEAARATSSNVMSDAAASAWLFLCRSADPSPRARRMGIPNLGAIVGRILCGLDESSVMQLYHLRTASDPGGTMVPPLSNGRTVMEEWRERGPNGSLAKLLGGHDHYYFFFSASMLSFLGARDALAYSGTCRGARGRGVRLLRRIRNSQDGGGNGGCDTNKSRERRGMERRGRWEEEGGMWSAWAVGFRRTSCRFLKPPAMMPTT